MRERSAGTSRQRGNALYLTLVLVTLLVGLAAAQVAVQQRNLQQTRFFLARKSLHKYAESGLAMALHEIRYNLSTSPGNIGTENWTTSYDYGRDGLAGTGDEGEGDGIPTPGEPEVYPVAVGSSSEGSRLIVHVLDTSSSDLKRVVATSFNIEASVTLEKHVQSGVNTVPQMGSVYADPNTVVDLRGESFLIDGRDHDLYGNLTGDAGMPALTTAIGDPAGDNAANLLAQISSKHYDQIVGADGSPSVGEVDGFEVGWLVQSLEQAKTQDIAPGTYSQLPIEYPEDGSLPVAYVNGNLILSGDGEATGVLIVDGSLEISGSSTWKGLIIVRGDIILKGGGASISTIGALIVGQSLTAIDDSDLSVTGNASLLYSSEALGMVQTTLNQTTIYEGVYYTES